MKTRGFRRVAAGAIVAGALVLVRATDAYAQLRLDQPLVRSDSTRRMDHFGRAVAYGVVTGLAFSLIDQWQNDPPEWGKGWNGYTKRAASNVGEFIIQEGVTEGLAIAMDRPMKYQRCKCTETNDRVWWAVSGAVLDPMPNGRREIAVPRIVGAYVGSLAQAMWRPESGSERTRLVLVNGTTSLLLGAAINLVYEFRGHHARGGTMAGDRGK